MANMNYTLIDDVASLATLIDNFSNIEITKPGCIYVDLEGNNLSRNGTLSLITIFIAGQNVVYLVDVTTLKGKAFSTPSSSSRTLRDMLENETLIKVFFDVRNDSDALYALHGIRLKGVQDLQLMELASRSFSRRCVNGLSKCIEQDVNMNWVDKCDWLSKKADIKKMFASGRGVSYDIFDHRPLDARLAEYCVQDVIHMPHLRKTYRAKLCDAWWTKIMMETEKRIESSHSPRYNGVGRHMALGPPSWVGWQPTLQQKQVRTMLEAGPEDGECDIGIRQTDAPSKASCAPTQERPEIQESSLTTTIVAATSMVDVPTSVEDSARLGPSVDKQLSRLSPGSRTPPWSSIPGNPHSDVRKIVVSTSDEEADSIMVSDAESETFWLGRFSSRRDSWDHEEAEDFAACDSECGYCGRCMY